MNPSIDFETIKQKHTIESVLERRGVRLLRASGGWVCACPIHGEKKGASFSINTRKQLWNCFGKCGDGGDVIRLIEFLDGVDAIGACEILEGRELRTGEHEVVRKPAGEQVRSEAILQRELPALPKLWKGELRHWELVANLRKVDVGTIAQMVRYKVLRFCKVYDQPAYAILDVDNPSNVQVRRLDGKLWFGRSKVMGVKGNWAQWPVGLDVALHFAKFPILLVEGTGDFIGGYALSLAAEDVGIPVAMFGASQSIHPSALPLFRDRRVLVCQQNDEAGARAALQWTQQLTDAGATVTVAVVPVEGADLNDHVSAGGGKFW